MSVENDPLVGTLRPRPGAAAAADVTLTLTDSLDISTVARFIESVAHAIAGGQRRVVADLRQVEFCDVSGLNALLWAHRRLTAEGGCLIITAPPRSLCRMLDILHLHQQLDVRGLHPATDPDAQVDGDVPVAATAGQPDGLGFWNNAATSAVSWSGSMRSST